MKIIRFSRAFLPCTILSVLIIASGLVRIATGGINLGLDFAPGLLEEVRIAPTALTLTYTGAARAVVEADTGQVSLIISGAGAENKTAVFAFSQYPTVDALAAALDQEEGIQAKLVGPGPTPSSAIFMDSSVSTVLSASASYRFHYTDAARLVTADSVRGALSSLDAISVKQMGAAGENLFQIRILLKDKVSTDQAAPETGGVTVPIQEQVSVLLRTAYGDDNMAVIKTDFVGAQFSRSLAFKSLFVVLATLVLIWVYSAIRFKWDFALAAVLAIIHDALVMITFIAWAQIEFSTMILAAILTIIGYSINATIVALDRVRENTKSDTTGHITEILDRAQTEILSRTIYTTVTTLLAVFALFIFTTGSMRTFALSLMVGIVSGIYSSIYIVGASIAFMRKPWIARNKTGK